MLYERIYKELTGVRYISVLKSIYTDDRSIQFEDIVGDIFIFCTDNSFEALEGEDMVEYLKAYYKLHRVNRHSNLIEDLDVGKDYCDDSAFYNMKYGEELADVNFTDEEVLCLLLARNKSNFKKYDYKFIEKGTEKAINNAKLRKQYESIIRKLLDRLGKNITSNVSKKI